ncbi:hypothetical protein MCOR27_006696 [Pyricularia oryzae]|uniref:Secreted protein n=1 Tax=Pyricularia grisea TaxID=148305 RepID=A0ABQ8NEH0_PYRGI|nr:hypothetical protein MCOR02_001957 [Pyricularia oryzae]KAI6295727.1 hypothetical protein MCOR33_007467 [Pyricularia grisea]KAI6254590.1 hypothetical protein MCOR19_008888 [Pyricularia oryzae]KAI6270735.1 hypothetical protein MCOR26_008125 [Pyricularia oryzae]KAI6276010.1 hypothetical protein MCOR27_006696 [Pyricularia oryzae]
MWLPRHLSWLSLLGFTVFNGDDGIQHRSRAVWTRKLLTVVMSEVKEAAQGICWLEETGDKLSSRYIILELVPRSRYIFVIASPSPELGEEYRSEHRGRLSNMFCRMHKV